MNTALLIAVLVCAAGIGIYLLVMIFRHRKPDNIFPKSMETDGKRQELTLSDSPIYQETKEIITELRSGLDRFKERSDNCFSSRSMSSQEKLTTACTESLPGMYEALNEARIAANGLLESVHSKSNSELESAVLVKVSETLSAPPIADKIEPSILDRVDGLVRRIQVIVDGVGPLIAHFYIALTLPDEEARLEEAAKHAASLVHHLDDSIFELKRIEKIIQG